MTRELTIVLEPIPFRDVDRGYLDVFLAGLTHLSATHVKC